MNPLFPETETKIDMSIFQLPPWREIMRQSQVEIIKDTEQEIADLITLSAWAETNGHYKLHMNLEGAIYADKALLLREREDLKRWE